MHSSTSFHSSIPTTTRRSSSALDNGHSSSIMASRHCARTMKCPNATTMSIRNAAKCIKLLATVPVLVSLFCAAAQAAATTTTTLNPIRSSSNNNSSISRTITDTRGLFPDNATIISGNNKSSTLSSSSFPLTATTTTLTAITMNSSMDLYNTTPTSSPEPASGMSLSMQIFFGILYTFIFVVGIAGNVLVCYVVFRNKAMQTVTNYFITNLALSDILLCILAVPFTPLYTFLGKWVFGTLLCHIVPYAQGCSVYISTLTLTAVAIDRFFVILYPFQPRMKLSVCIGIIVSIWTFALLVTLPYGLYMRIESDFDILYCEENWPGAHMSIKIIFSITTTLLQFAIPFLVITFCYVCVSIKLNDRARAKPGSKTSKREEADRDRKKRTNRMLIAMVAVFGISWMPLNVYNILADLTGESSSSLIFFFVTHAIAMSSTCYNPFLYAWLNENFRKEFIQILPCLFRALSPLNGTTVGTGTSGPNTGSTRNNNNHNRSRRCQGPTSTYDPERLIDHHHHHHNSNNNNHQKEQQLLEIVDGEQRLLSNNNNNNNNHSNCSDNNTNNCDSDKTLCQKQDPKDSSTCSSSSVLGICGKVASNVLSKRTRDPATTTTSETLSTAQIPLVDPISSCTSSSCTTATSSSMISGHHIVSSATVSQLSPQHRSVDTTIVGGLVPLATHSNCGGNNGINDGILETHFEETPSAVPIVYGGATLSPI